MASKDRENEELKMKNEKRESNMKVMRKTRSQVCQQISVSHSPLLTPCFFLFLFFSCQTTPKTADSFLQDTNVFPLDHGASLYIFADAKEARPIIDLLPLEELNDSQTKQMLDRTNFFAAALFPKESGRRFQLAAWGSYPSSQADFAFSINKDWSKNRSQSGGSYWYSSVNRLSLAIGSKQAFAASSLTAQPFDPVTATAGVAMPEGFAEFRAGSPFSCWLEDPSPVIRRILNDAGIPVNFPVQQLFINLLPTAKDQYTAVLRLHFANASFARGVAAIFSLSENFSIGNSVSVIASVFLANPPVLDGSHVDIRSAVLNKEELAMLLSLFFVN